MSEIPRVAVTCGEPAGIGYELLALAASKPQTADLIAIGDPELLRERAALCGVDLDLRRWTPDQPAAPSPAGTLKFDPVPLARPAEPGRPDPANAEAVLETIRRGTQYCVDGTCDALATAPIHKGVINDAGVPFSGHTEMLSELTGGAMPVMMLVAGDLRVALATTHMPLRQVPEALTPQRLESIIMALHSDLIDKFAIATPRIVVTGLNPHAGEGGHLGREEIDTIIPVLERLRETHMHLTGPVPADTAFTPQSLPGTDAVLAMYHDQGLPVVKHVGFGRAVNVTLGLPIVRTSVDHGTAFDLAGTCRADGGSLQAAIDLAADLAVRRLHQQRNR